MDTSQFFHRNLKDSTRSRATRLHSTTSSVMRAVTITSPSASNFMQSTVSSTVSNDQKIEVRAAVASNMPLSYQIPSADLTSVQGLHGYTKADTKKQAASHTKRPKIEFLDGLRGIAAICVVLHHAHILEAGINIGASAVDIFFVLSSFLLTMIFETKTRQLLARKASIQVWLFALLDYAIKRFLRVYPLFAVVAILLWYLPNESRERYYIIGSPENYDLIKVLTFDEHSRYFVMWTLPLEITYYFLIPVLVIGICLLGRAWWLAVACIYVWIIDEGIRVDRRSFLPLRVHLPTFVAGSLAAIVYAQLNVHIKQRGITLFGWKSIACVRSIQLGLLALTLSLSFHGLVFHWVAPNPFEQHEGASPFISLPLSVMIILEILFPSLLSQLLDWKLLSYASKISFSMYLLHPFVIKNPWIENGQETWHDQFFAWFVLVLALATASYWAIEYPSLLLAQAISGRLHAWEQERISASSITTPVAEQYHSNFDHATYRQLLQRFEQVQKPGHKFA